ncbi:MAG TPA: hypothetical protein PKA33_01485 [Amaricoccus sp.]|uniref:hypothetical protein n=1 Tax=Amaricoccus sp. TaxID=1872485 RepID=UPI002CEC4104|nr:hypothetical protein [Amaricoccus sp.]HMR51233.1 hypothetical protein [Amaricoccus sp.]HMT98018.1 hypothetical protein [Amaricoccus sp.]
MTHRAIARMNAARNFPENTCPASRHAEICADKLISEGRYTMIESEPEHVGESIAATVAALWDARSFLISLGYSCHIGKNGRSEWRK